jgi:hypothetical protein
MSVSLAMLPAGVAASADDLARFDASGSDPDRVRFLDGMHSLVLLWCEWARPYVDRGEELPTIDEPLRSDFVGLNDARNRITGYDPKKGVEAAAALVAEHAAGCH